MMLLLSGCRFYGWSKNSNNSACLLLVTFASILLCLSQFTIFVHAGRDTHATKQQPPSIPSQILRAKIPNSWQQQQSEQQLWLYEGALYDPLDGRRVASVRGLELIKPLNDTTNLAIDSLLKHPNATYEDSQTVWSQKIFCYTTNSELSTTPGKNSRSKKENTETDDTTPQQQSEESILSSVKIRPQSPRKEVPLDQAVAVYETATTFVSRRKTKAKDDSDDDVEVLVHSEWPNGQTVWGVANQESSSSNNSRESGSSNSMEFTVFAKLRNKHSPLYAPDLVRNKEDDERNAKNKDGLVVSPQRAALVQFGSADKTMETKHKFGARETYSYRNIATNNDAKVDKASSSPLQWLAFWKKPKKSSNTAKPLVHYTRYGEGPPFYAPGRMCMLELKGRPVQSLREVGPLLRGLVAGNNHDKQQQSPPVTNFHWRESPEEASNDQRSRRTKKKKDRATSDKTVSTRNEPLPISIQSAWNLRTTRNPTTPSRRRRPRKQPLVMTLDTTTTTSNSNENVSKWQTWKNKGTKHATNIWNRIKASTTMESKS